MRSQTIPIKKLTRAKIAAGRILYPDTGHRKPRYRYECKHGIRPCPYVSCKYHLYLDVNPDTGTIKLNFPDIEVWEMEESCALDIAERCGATLDEIGRALNLCRERVRQIEAIVLKKIRSESYDWEMTENASNC